MSNRIDGQPDGIIAAAAELTSRGSTLVEAGLEMRKVTQARAQVWTGDAATAFDKSLLALVPPLTAAQADLESAAEIERRFASELERIQMEHDRAVKALQDAEGKRGLFGRLFDAASHAVADAERRLAQALDAEARALAAESAANAAGTTSGQHQQAVSLRTSAQEALRAAADKARQNGTELDRAGADVRSAVAAVERIEDEYHALVNRTKTALDSLPIVTDADRAQAKRYRNLKDPELTYKEYNGIPFWPFDDQKIYSQYDWSNFYDSPLFSSRGPSPDDIHQGADGDCWVLAALIAQANTNPASIRQLITDNGDGTYTVHLKSGDQVVDADLPSKNGQLAYAGLGQGKYTWTAIVEKAYAQSRHNSYQGIDGGYERDALKDIFGVDTHSSSPGSCRDDFQAAIRAGRPTTADVNIQDLIPGFSGSGGHALAVVGISGSGADAVYTIRNPWNDQYSYANGRGGTFTMTASEFEKTFNEVTYAKS